MTPPAADLLSPAPEAPSVERSPIGRANVGAATLPPLFAPGGEAALAERIERRLGWERARIAEALEHPIFVRLSRRRQRRAGRIVSIREGLTPQRILAESLELAWQTPLGVEGVFDALCAATLARSGDFHYPEGERRPTSRAAASLWGVASLAAILLFFALAFYLEGARFFPSRRFLWRIEPWRELIAPLLAIAMKLAAFVVVLALLALGATWAAERFWRRSLWRKLTAFGAGFIAAEPFERGYIRTRMALSWSAIFLPSIPIAVGAVAALALSEGKYGAPYLALMWESWDLAIRPFGLMWACFAGGWAGGVFLFAWTSPGDAALRAIAIDHLQRRRARLLEGNE